MKKYYLYNETRKQFVDAWTVSNSGVCNQFRFYLYESVSNAEKYDRDTAVRYAKAIELITGDKVSVKEVD